MEGRIKLEIGRKEAHDTGNPWPHLEAERSKVKVTRPINVVNENQPHLRNGKAYELQTWYTDGVRWPESRHAWWPPTWKLWVSVHVTSRRGREHIVSAPLQAEQLVIYVIINHPMKSVNPVIFPSSVDFILTTIVICSYHLTYEMAIRNHMRYTVTLPWSFYLAHPI